MAGNKILTYSELVDDYNQNHLKNLYLFFGKEDFLKENILKRIKEKFEDDTSQ